MATRSRPPRNANQRALRRLRGLLDATYPPGHFVAIGDGRVIGQAASFAELEAQLRAMGRARGESLVVEVGAEPPEPVQIFL